MKGNTGRLTSVHTIKGPDGKTHEQVFCFGHLWGPAFFKKGTKDYEEYLAIVKRLAEYENLEEQGKLLRLPCAVGDKVYAVEADEENFDHYYCPVKITELSFHPGMLELIGRCVFLDREEAEAACKEMEGRE